MCPFCCLHNRNHATTSYPSSFLSSFAGSLKGLPYQTSQSPLSAYVMDSVYSSKVNFTVGFFTTITMHSSFMKSSCRLQSKLRRNLGVCSSSHFRIPLFSPLYNASSPIYSRQETCCNPLFHQVYH